MKQPYSVHTYRDRVLTKDELVKHLEAGHGLTITHPRWTTKADLADTHRLIHLAKAGVA